MKKYSQGFSLVELLIGLIAVACIVAAVTPVIIKKMKKSAIVAQGGAGDTTQDCADKFNEYCTYCNSSVCLTCDRGCDSGYYLDIDSCSCKSCSSINTNCSECSDSSTCTSCNDGYYLSNSTTCTKCTKGSYCINGVKSCCIKGTITSETGLSSCTDCPAGTYSNSTCSTSCINCEAGYYSNSGASSCTKCPSGTYSSTGSSNCTNCEAGTYSNSGSSSCTNCPEGTYSNAKASSCISCLEGYYSIEGSSSCETCQAGTYSTAGSGSCSDCLAGTYSSSSGASSCTYCSSTTTNCTECNKKTGSCTECDSGYYVYSNSCYICPKGYYCNGTTKTVCPKGTYASTIGNTSCIECEAGYYSTSTGKTTACTSTCSSKTENCETCEADTGICTKCKDGYDLEDGSCIKEDWCTLENGLVKIEEAGICVTQYNIGDNPDGYYPIPDAIGVTVFEKAKDTGSPYAKLYCNNASNSYSDASRCCWQGSATTGCTDKLGTYSGCSRTVCDFVAAYHICKNLNYLGYTDWRLPDQDDEYLNNPYIDNNRKLSSTELKYFADYSLGLGEKGLMLCDDENYSDDYEKCNGGVNYTDRTCNGATNSTCRAAYIWSGYAQEWDDDENTNGIGAWVYRLYKGNWGAYSSTIGYARSVRCVRDLD